MHEVILYWLRSVILQEASYNMHASKEILETTWIISVLFQFGINPGKQDWSQTVIKDNISKISAEVNKEVRKRPASRDSENGVCWV